MYLKNYTIRDKACASIEKMLIKMKKDGIITEFYLTQSNGMGSYETFYVEFLKLVNPEDEWNPEESWEIRYSNHSNGHCDYHLWDRDFNTLTEIKKAIKEIILNAN